MRVVRCRGRMVEWQGERWHQLIEAERVSRAIVNDDVRDVRDNKWHQGFGRLKW